MTGPEMAERSARQAQLQEQLDLRNVQISELQKEILLAEQDKEKSGDRWSKMTSMNDAKLAISYLFNSATESMASVHQRQQEVRELRTQIEDLLTNSKNLKEKLSQQKMNHETEICRMEREREKNALVLLNQMYNGDDGNETKDMSMTKDIVDKMLGNEKAIERALTTNEKVSSLQEEVERLQAELVQLRSGGSSNVFLQPPVGSRPTGSVKKNRRVTIMKPIKEAKPEVK